jgi:GNAT superfamily N-acetyltransferase
VTADSPASATIRPLEENDFDGVAALAREIWLAHYTSIITTEQIEYMLAGRFTHANLRGYLASAERWMDLLHVGSELAGYCSFALTSTPEEMKLEQLYLLPRHHGVGLGARLLGHVESRALDRGARTLILQVNKRNDKALKLYVRAGYAVREEVVVDIGRGFVMDDYVMAKALRR